MMWRGQDLAADTHIAFRGEFSTDRDVDVEIHIAGASTYLVWLDGELLLDGPPRFVPGKSEYQTAIVHLDAGQHALAVHLHHEGVDTRIQQACSPFLECDVWIGGKLADVDWCSAILEGYESSVCRINPQLGWIDWCDTRLDPPGWPSRSFDYSSWARVNSDGVSPTVAQASPQKNCKLITHRLSPIANGNLAETFGYEKDDPAARFFLRDLQPTAVPAQGEWRRYDLGRVRLGRPRFFIDAEPGTVIEFAMSESLDLGRVVPWITLSAGPSCNLDHFVARGGWQEFMPHTPKGGRYLELHIVGCATVEAEEFVERTYHGEPIGALESSDPLLDRIWSVGVETYRACSEDAVIDNPTRERGQWAGDVVSVGMDIASVAYGDLSLIRRGLVQCADCARDDGLVAGLCPGGVAYLTTYAAQWVSACRHYVELTGDRTILADLREAAEANSNALLTRAEGWAFVDWGYVRNDDCDIALDLHLFGALQDFRWWCGGTSRFDSDLRSLAGRISDFLVRQPSWEAIGFHGTTLALRYHLTRDPVGALEYLMRHIRSCFPNDPAAPRLSSPSAESPRLISPYFAHYALAELWRHGAGDFVLDQYRRCWGWMLDQGATTWWEVFDPRWSRCHQWSGCPTWQLTRFLLGFHHRLDVGEGVFDFGPVRTSLEHVSGTIPFGDGRIRVGIDWTNKPTAHIVSESPIVVRYRSLELSVDRKLTIPLV